MNIFTCVQISANNHLSSVRLLDTLSLFLSLSSWVETKNCWLQMKVQLLCGSQTQESCLVGESMATSAPA